MAACVIHLLEAVQVDEQRTERLLAGRCGGLFQQDLEGCPVGQAGELVVRGRPGELLPLPQSLRHVGDHPDDPLRRVVGDHGPAAHVRPEGGAVAPHQFDLAVEHALRGECRLGAREPGFMGFAGGEDGLHGSACHLRGLAAEDGAELPADHLEAAVARHGNADLGVVEYGLQLPQQRLGLAALAFLLQQQLPERPRHGTDLPGALGPAIGGMVAPGQHAFGAVAQPGDRTDGRPGDTAGQQGRQDACAQCGGPCRAPGGFHRRQGAGYRRQANQHPVRQGNAGQGNHVPLGQFGRGDGVDRAAGVAPAGEHLAQPGLIVRTPEHARRMGV
jgi:hypothetical protein